MGQKALTVCHFCLIFIIYLFCAYPAFAPRDSADMAKAALTLGVAHPPGYPLYSVLGKAWLSVFPWGNPAYGLNVLSAAAGSGACALFFLVLRRRADTFLSSAAALSLAFSAPLWKFSLLPEKYVGHVFFITLLLALTTRFESSRFRSLAGLILGLGCVNHQSLILILPALLYLGLARSPRLPTGLFFVLGLALNIFLWVRLGDANLAWRVLTRAEYGSLELFRGLAAPLDGARAWGLLKYLTEGLARALSPLAVIVGACGIYRLWRQERKMFWSLALLLTFFGPVFFLMTRFETSSWVARSVLEPAFLAPAVAVCFLAAVALVDAPRPWGHALAAGLVAWGAWANAPGSWHRDDFSAYDYARDLRRMIPPGSAAVIQGDTALFSLAYWDAWRGESLREILGEPQRHKAAFLLNRGRRGETFVSGFPLESLAGLGLGRYWRAEPRGLVQRVLARGQNAWPSDKTVWELSVLRWPRSFDSGESYGRDIRWAYAVAHYLSARLCELNGVGGASEHYRRALLLAPEDFEPVSEGK